MRSKIGDKASLLHILDAITEIENYIKGVDYPKFMDNSMIRFACIKQLEIIGEASNHVSNELKSSYSDVQWDQIIGMRNIFVHEYFGVDNEIVWEIITNDLPVFKKVVSQICSSLELN